MARTDTLGNFLTDVASAIKDKKGDTTPIKASDFDTEIANLPSGGGGDDLSEYFVTKITENTSTSFQLDSFKKIAPITVSDNVTSLSDMFLNYKFFGQKEVDEFPKVICGNNITNMRTMYAPQWANTKYPTKIDVSGLDTSNVTTMYGMFRDRVGLLSLNLKNFDFSKITDMGSMFGSCSSIEELDLSNLREKSSVSLSCHAMCSQCSNLKKIDIRNLDRLARGGQMFFGCVLLEEIDFDNLTDLPGNPSWDYSMMFYDCGKDLPDGQLTKVYVKDANIQNWILTGNNHHPDTWSTENVIIAGSEQDLRIS